MAVKNLKMLLILIIFLSLIGPDSSSAAVTNGNHVVLESSEDEEGMIFFPEQVEEGPDGNFYVLDTGDSFIKVFSPTGQYLNKMGGQGEGPGEFQRTDGATFGFTPDDKLFFTEYIRGHRWISILELNGDLSHVFSPQLDIMFGVSAAVALNDGGFLVQFVYNSVPRAQGDFFFYDSPRALARVDSLGSIVSEIVATNCTRMISYVSGGATTTLPFTPVFAWASTGNNEVIWSDGLSPRLQVFNDSGQMVREIETALPEPEAVTQDDLKQWKAQREEQMVSRDPVWWGRFGRVIEEYKNPFNDKPILGTISTTPGGNLLIQGRSSSETGELIYWLLRENGETLARVSVAAHGVHFSENYLLFVTYDEEENPQVHAMGHLGNEVSAVGKLEVIVESMVE